ncbi:MAG TPA: hypothetical protein VMJ65_00220 [Solirubrobacteraceae bacterium]|nr:hypothetical protein [Solirubrobacteraceae bacterium]
MSSEAFVERRGPLRVLVVSYSAHRPQAARAHMTYRFACTVSPAGVFRSVVPLTTIDLRHGVPS